MGGLKGKVVLISDASAPSGKVFAEKFAEQGAVLALNFTEERDAGAGAYSYNTATGAGARALVDDVVRDHGGIDVLIHNDNEVTKFSIQESTDAQVKLAMDRNAKTAFMLTQAAGGYMKDHGGGSIVYVSSIHAGKPSGSSFAYSMAKSMVGLLCKEVVLDLSPYGVRANVIEMGPIAGDTETYASDISRLYDHVDLKIKGRDLGDWEQAANLALFLSDDGCPFLNGQSIQLDGGFLLHYGYRFTYDEWEQSKEEVMRRMAEWAAKNNASPQTEDEPQKVLTGMNLAGKIAVITGSATGVGQGIAVRFAAEGAKVVVTHNNAPADKTMAMIREVGGTAIDVGCNVGNEEDVIRLIAAAKENFGGLDILVNNAAIQYNKWILEYSEEEYDTIININADAYVRCIRHAAPLLKESKSGRIINIGSIHSKRPTGFDSVYTMSKAANLLLAREAAIELAAWGVTANTITIGAINIGVKSGAPFFRPPNRPPNVREMPYGHLLSGKVGTPPEVGFMAAFLASDESRFITGSALRADGGIMMV
ncbi:MAG: SDR family oxidoreductase [Oscillospiraceae bacterium]|nr:SDR family oxidoreductase [Oscillospiraceae bacterium]